ncbi:MAG: DUF4330 domain-containing protein [Coprothermobacterota bacterium]|nr:DUF4330 domain-containing protein [Coprothermobacterota bacterium]
MPLIDSQGKLFGKINVFDLLVVLIVVGVLAFLGLKYFSPSDNQAFAQDCQVTLAWGNVEPDIAKWVKVGDQATDGGGNVLLEVAEVTVRPARVPVTTADGEMIVIDHPHLVSVFIVAHTPRVAQSGNFEFKGQEMKIGISIIVSMDKPVLGSVYKFSGLIMGIEFVPPRGEYPAPLLTP